MYCSLVDANANLIRVDKLHFILGKGFFPLEAIDAMQEKTIVCWYNNYKVTKIKDKMLLLQLLLQDFLQK